MIEFYSDGDRYIVSFNNYGKMIISDENFKIEGNASEVAVQFAAYIYSYMINDSHQHAEIHRFYNSKHVISLTFGNVFHSHLHVQFLLFKNKNFKIDLTWNGEQNAQWHEFENTFNRYFSLKTFL